jgi:hypothetical protein
MKYDLNERRKRLLDVENQYKVSIEEVALVKTENEKLVLK